MVADISFGQALLAIVEVFLFVAWLLDPLRGHRRPLPRPRDVRLGKAAWVIVLILLPLLGTLIYLIVRGQGMRDRTIAEQAAVKSQMDTYVRETAGTSSADQLHKLSDLKQRGDITEAEFEREKAKLLA